VDGLGSTTGLTDGSGSVTDTYTYDAFGAVKAQTGSSANGWRFTGELQDYQVARQPLYLRARYYDPALGRFVILIHS
jgi:YD repeat-containing protein